MQLSRVLKALGSIPRLCKPGVEILICHPSSPDGSPFQDQESEFRLHLNRSSGWQH